MVQCRLHKLSLVQIWLSQWFFFTRQLACGCLALVVACFKCYSDLKINFYFSLDFKTMLINQ